MITSRIKVGHPERLFRYGDEDEKKMQVQFARLCVLYDDLTLEFTAANEDAIPLLDKSGRDNRRFYFVRRTLGTLSELRGAIGALEKSTTFQARKAAWEHGAQKEWSGPQSSSTRITNSSRTGGTTWEGTFTTVPQLSRQHVRLISRVSGLCLIGGGAWLALTRAR